MWPFKINVWKMRDNKNVLGLIKALSHKETYVRKYAAEALGRIGDARAVGPLCNALKDSKRDVRVAAAVALVTLYRRKKLDAFAKQRILARRETINTPHDDHTTSTAIQKENAFKKQENVRHNIGHTGPVLFNLGSQ